MEPASERVLLRLRRVFLNEKLRVLLRISAHRDLFEGGLFDAKQ